jgi:tRNA A37 N6-isopentenylltransferase MiaA
MEWQHADFASWLFYDAATSVSDYTVLMVGREMNDQIARIWKVMVVIGTSMYYPSTLLERLRKTTRSLNQDSTLTNIQTGHPPIKILQHYYYSNVIGKVG